MRHRSGTVAMAAMIALAIGMGACTASPSASSEAPSASAEPTEPERSTSPTAAQSEPAQSEPAQSEPAEAERVEVVLADSSFDPAVLTIAAGTEVVFVNGDTYGHTVTEGSGGVAVDDPFVDEGLETEPISVVFDEPGAYELTCRIHPTMSMEITVEA
jgi:plastocyanin